MSTPLQWKRHILGALGFFVVYWISDAVVDALSFGDAPFLDELLSPDPREIFTRSVSALLLAMLFLLYSSLVNRRRSVEAALKRSDELSAIFLESTKDAICIIDTESLLITAANPVFLQRYRLDEREAVGRSFPDLVTRHGLPEEVLAQLARTAASGIPATGEISYQGVNGERRYEEISTHPIGEAWQGVGRVLQVTRDITLRRNSEALLKESEAWYRSIFENTGTAMAIIRPDGVLHMVNRGFEGLTGFSREELEGKRLWTDFVAPADREGVLAQLAGRQAGCVTPHCSFELQMVDRSGLARPMAGNCASIAGSQDLVLSLVDISTQKRVEEALRDSRAKLAIAQHMAHLGTWEWELASDKLIWSEEVFRIFDLDPATASPTYDGFLQAIHPEDRERVIRAVNDALYNKKPYQLDYRITLPGGVVRVLAAWGEVYYDAQGNPLRMVGTCQDVTWRTEAEQAIRMSEEKFSKAFLASPDSVVITRAEDGTYIDVNQAFEETTGYRRDEVIGKSSTALKLWADPEARMVMLRLLNQYGHVRNLDVRFRVKSGELRELLWSAEVIEYRGEACLIAISRDVTDQRHLERELLESDARLYMKHEELKNLFHQMEAIRREWEETMDCISDMFILADQWGKIRRFNRAVELFTGKAHRDIVGRDWLPFLEEHGLHGHLQTPGVDLLHESSGRWFVLKRYAFPTAEVDGSTREVIIINDTTGLRLRPASSRLRLATPRRHPN